MLVVVATEEPDLAEVRRQLQEDGAADLDQCRVGGGRILVYGGPFDDRQAVAVTGRLRGAGWSADVRPEGGGHLAAWQSHTQAVTAGRLLVCFPWSESDRSQADAVVEIDPGSAFGTGAHPSTRLLLDALAGRIHGGESVLDVGCGSGVLAIAAARLGAGRVLGTDLFPPAIESTRRNAARNHLGDLVEATSTPLQELAGDFDVVVANIEAPTLAALPVPIVSRLAARGWLAVSGVSPAQTSKVAAAYRPLRVEAELRREDWSALILVR